VWIEVATVPLVICVSEVSDYISADVVEVLLIGGIANAMDGLGYLPGFDELEAGWSFRRR
jgi:hypothetical protein